MVNYQKKTTINSLITTYVISFEDVVFGAREGKFPDTKEFKVCLFLRFFCLNSNRRALILNSFLFLIQFAYIFYAVLRAGKQILKNLTIMALHIFKKMSSIFSSVSSR